MYFSFLDGKQSYNNFNNGIIGIIGGEDKKKKRKRRKKKSIIKPKYHNKLSQSRNDRLT